MNESSVPSQPAAAGAAARPHPPPLTAAKPSGLSAIFARPSTPSPSGSGSTTPVRPSSPAPGAPPSPRPQSPAALFSKPAATASAASTSTPTKVTTTTALKPVNSALISQLFGKKSSAASSSSPPSAVPLQSAAAGAAGVPPSPTAPKPAGLSAAFAKPAAAPSSPAAAATASAAAPKPAAVTSPATAAVPAAPKPPVSPAQQTRTVTTTAAASAAKPPTPAVTAAAGSTPSKPASPAPPAQPRPTTGVAAPSSANAAAPQPRPASPSPVTATSVGAASTATPATRPATTTIPAPARAATPQPSATTPKPALSPRSASPQPSTPSTPLTVAKSIAPPASATATPPSTGLKPTPAPAQPQAGIKPAAPGTATGSRPASPQPPVVPTSQPPKTAAATIPPAPGSAGPVKPTAITTPAGPPPAKPAQPASLAAKPAGSAAAVSSLSPANSKPSTAPASKPPTAPPSPARSPTPTATPSPAVQPQPPSLHPSPVPTPVQRSASPSPSPTPQRRPSTPTPPPTTAQSAAPRPQPPQASATDEQLKATSALAGPQNSATQPPVIALYAEAAQITTPSGPTAGLAAATAVRPASSSSPSPSLAPSQPRPPSRTPTAPPVRQPPPAPGSSAASGTATPASLTSGPGTPAKQPPGGQPPNSNLGVRASPTGTRSPSITAASVTASPNIPPRTLPTTAQTTPPQPSAPTTAPPMSQAPQSQLQQAGAPLTAPILPQQTPTAVRRPSSSTAAPQSAPRTPTRIATPQGTQSPATARPVVAGAAAASSTPPMVSSVPPSVSPPGQPSSRRPSGAAAVPAPPPVSVTPPTNGKLPQSATPPIANQSGVRSLAATTSASPAGTTTSSRRPSATTAGATTTAVAAKPNTQPATPTIPQPATTQQSNPIPSSAILNPARRAPAGTAPPWPIASGGHAMSSSAGAAATTTTTANLNTTAPRINAVTASSTTALDPDTEMSSWLDREMAELDSLDKRRTNRQSATAPQTQPQVNDVNARASATATTGTAVQIGAARATVASTVNAAAAASRSMSMPETRATLNTHVSASATVDSSTRPDTAASTMDGDGDDDDAVKHNIKSQLAMRGAAEVEEAQLAASKMFGTVALDELPPAPQFDPKTGEIVNDPTSGITYHYALKMKTFHHVDDPTDRSDAERNFMLIYGKLVELIGSSHLHIVSRGQFDDSHAYIRVSASLQTLEELAEQEQLMMPGLNDDYHPFDRQLKATRMRFAHPGKKQCQVIAAACQTMAARAGVQYDPNKPAAHYHNLDPTRSLDNGQTRANKLSTFEAEHPCTCDLFVPYQKQEMIRVLIERALDSALADIEKQEFYRKKRHVHKDYDPLSTTKRGMRELKNRKILMDMFPLHVDPPSYYYESRKNILNNYLSWRTSYRTAFQSTTRSENYIAWIRDYFGEKIALYFAFLHYYNKWLFILLLCGLPAVIWEFIENDNVDNPLTIVYAGISIIWGIFFIKFWVRHCADLAYDWNMLKYEETELEMDSFFLNAMKHPKGKKAVFGFYEPGGHWVDLKQYAIRARLQYSKDDTNGAIIQFIPTSHRDMTGRCPGCCFSYYGDSNNPDTWDIRSMLNSIIWRITKQFIGGFVILTLIGCVIAVAVSMIILRLLMNNVLGSNGSIVAGLINGAVIFLLDIIYRWFAIRLTEWENHRTATQFEDNLIAKCFAFQFINSYFSLLYIAFMKSGTDSVQYIFTTHSSATECAGVNCMQELEDTVRSILFARLVISFFVQRLLPRYLIKGKIAEQVVRRDITDGVNHITDGVKDLADNAVKLGTDAVNLLNTTTKTTFSLSSHHINNDDHMLHSTATSPLTTKTFKKNNKVHPSDSSSLLKLILLKDKNHVEYQSAMPPYAVTSNVSGVVDDYNELCIGFGYVLMFAAACPIAPIITLLHNIIEHSTDGYKMLRNHQKPKYYGTRDIGRYYHILIFLLFASILTNVGIVLFTSTQIKDTLIVTSDYTSYLTLVLFGILFEHLFCFIGYIIWITLANMRPSLRKDLAMKSKIKDIEDEYLDWLERRNITKINSYADMTTMNDEEDNNTKLSDDVNPGQRFPLNLSRAGGKRRTLVPGTGSPSIKGTGTGSPVIKSMQSPDGNMLQGQSQLSTDGAVTTNNNTTVSNVSSTNTHLSTPLDKQQWRDLHAGTSRVPPLILEAGTMKPRAGRHIEGQISDICFPFVIRHVSDLDDVLVSDACVIGRAVYRLVVAKSRKSQTIEFMVRYVAGPLPHSLSGYLLARDARRSAPAMARTLVVLFESYGGYGFTEFASIAELEHCGAYDPKQDKLTLGLLIPNSMWMGTAMEALIDGKKLESAQSERDFANRVAALPPLLKPESEQRYRHEQEITTEYVPYDASSQAAVAANPRSVQAASLVPPLLLPGAVPASTLPSLSLNSTTASRLEELRQLRQRRMERERELEFQRRSRLGHSSSAHQFDELAKVATDVKFHEVSSLTTAHSRDSSPHRHQLPPVTLDSTVGGSSMTVEQRKQAERQARIAQQRSEAERRQRALELEERQLGLARDRVRSTDALAPLTEPERLGLMTEKARIRKAELERIENDRARRIAGLSVPPLALSTSITDNEPRSARLAIDIERPRSARSSRIRPHSASRSMRSRSPSPAMVGVRPIVPQSDARFGLFPRARRSSRNRRVVDESRSNSSSDIDTSDGEDGRLRRRELLQYRHTPGSPRVLDQLQRDRSLSENVIRPLPSYAEIALSDVPPPYIASSASIQLHGDRDDMNEWQLRDRIARRENDRGMSAVDWWRDRSRHSAYDDEPRRQPTRRFREEYDDRPDIEWDDPRSRSYDYNDDDRDREGAEQFSRDVRLTPRDIDSLGRIELTPRGSRLDQQQQRVIRDQLEDNFERLLRTTDGTFR